MSNRYKGGIISATPPTTTGGESGTASGAWTLEQQMQAQAAGLWPLQPTGPYIEDVFSTWLYTGNSSANTIPNGIDLAGKGGLIWLKQRNAAVNHGLFDTVRGGRYGLYSNATAGNVDWGSNVVDFGTTGQTINNFGDYNDSGQPYVSWTFREAPKFFDVVTYTGTGSNQNISHNLQSVPGCIIVKRTDSTGNWTVLARQSNGDYSLWTNSDGLNTTTAATFTDLFNLDLTDTTFNPQKFTGSGQNINASGGTYVAYLFAHNAGGFGLSGTDNVISCGSFTTDGSGNATVDLGYEPQWFLIKRSSGADSWYLLDNMRGFTMSADAALQPNTSDNEVSLSGFGYPTATGWSNVGDNAQFFTSSTYIYIAIRRGPMRTPTTGTSVFEPEAYTGSGSAQSVTTGFPVDLNITKRRAAASPIQVTDRLRGSSTTYFNYLRTNAADAETTGSTYGFGLDNNTGYVDNLFSTFNSGNTLIGWNFRRAPGFFDEVCYTGDSAAFRAVPHNLGVAPELMIFKTRNNTNPWWVYAAPVGATKYLTLNTGNSAITLDIFGNTAPTSSVFYVNGNYWINFTATVVAYLFASVPGVSKVGGYTGTGTTQTINCGFTGGARFVMIKRTDDAGGGFAGDWYVWDSARGIVAGNDPYLLLNSTAAEVTNTDYIDTASTGFEISSTAPADINASGGTFIFLAIS